MRTRILGKMLNTEVQEYLNRNDIIIVPVGTTEMHGGFPLDCETVISEAYALKMAEACDGLVLTGLPYFYAGATASGRGTVQVSVRQGIDYLGALARSLLRLGFKRQVYISFHGPAHMAICPMIRDFYDETGVPILYMDSMMNMNKCRDLFQSFAAFRALPAEKLFSFWQETRKEMKGGGCFPVLDGRFVVGTGTDLLAAGRQKDIPYMAGSTSEDMMPPIIYSMSRDWCAAQRQKSYAWFFDRRLPGDNCGAWHSSDLWYWFGTLPNCWRPMEKKDYDLSDQMVDYLTNFCKNGDPNGKTLPHWENAGKKSLHLGEGETKMAKPNMLKLAWTMLTNRINHSTKGAVAPIYRVFSTFFA